MNFGIIDGLIEEMDSSEKIFVGVDLNSHIVKMLEGMIGCIEDIVMQRKVSMSYDTRFSMSFNLILANTCFIKKEERSRKKVDLEVAK